MDPPAVLPQHPRPRRWQSPSAALSSLAGLPFPHGASGASPCPGLRASAPSFCSRNTLTQKSQVFLQMPASHQGTTQNLSEMALPVLFPALLSSQHQTLPRTLGFTHQLVHVPPPECKLHKDRKFVFWSLLCPQLLDSV